MTEIQIDWSSVSTLVTRHEVQSECCGLRDCRTVYCDWLPHLDNKCGHNEATVEVCGKRCHVTWGFVSWKEREANKWINAKRVVVMSYLRVCNVPSWSQTHLSTESPCGFYCASCHLALVGNVALGTVHLSPHPTPGGSSQTKKRKYFFISERLSKSRLDLDWDSCCWRSLSRLASGCGVSVISAGIPWDSTFPLNFLEQNASHQLSWDQELFQLADGSIQLIVNSHSRQFLFHKNDVQLVLF